MSTLRQPSNVHLEHPTDVLLAKSASRGEVWAQREIFDRLKPSVRATLYRVLGSSQYMDDLMQEAFIEIFGSVARYRGQSRLQTWADRVTARVALNHLRRQIRSRTQHAELALRAESAELVGPEDTAVHREGVRHLRSVLARLGRVDRLAFALFELHGRTIAEVARELGTTRLAAKTRVSRARRKVREAAHCDRLLVTYFSSDAELASDASAAAPVGRTALPPRRSTTQGKGPAKGGRSRPDDAAEEPVAVARKALQSAGSK